MDNKFQNFINLADFFNFKTFREALIVNRVLTTIVGVVLTYYLLISVGDLRLQMSYITLAVLFKISSLAKLAQAKLELEESEDFGNVFAMLLANLSVNHSEIVQEAVGAYNEELIEAGLAPFSMKFVKVDEDGEEGILGELNLEEMDLKDWEKFKKDLEEEE